MASELTFVTVSKLNGQPRPVEHVSSEDLPAPLQGITFVPGRQISYSASMIHPTLPFSDCDRSVGRRANLSDFIHSASTDSIRVRRRSRSLSFFPPFRFTQSSKTPSRTNFLHLRSEWVISFPSLLSFHYYVVKLLSEIKTDLPSVRIFPS